MLVRHWDREGGEVGGVLNQFAISLTPLFPLLTDQTAELRAALDGVHADAMSRARKHGGSSSNSAITNAEAVPAAPGVAVVDAPTPAAVNNALRRASFTSASSAELDGQDPLAPAQQAVAATRSPSASSANVARSPTVLPPPLPVGFVPAKPAGPRRK